MTGRTVIPEYVSRAFHVAQSGRPGPVVLALPEDVLTAQSDAKVLPIARLASGEAATRDIFAILEFVVRARRPFVLVGGPLWSDGARHALERFAEITGVPVGTSFRCQDYMDNNHPNYAGDVGIAPNPALAETIREADLILALGARLGEMTTGGYSLLAPPNPRQKLIHVHPILRNPGGFIFRHAPSPPGPDMWPHNWRARPGIVMRPGRKELNM